MTAALPPSGRPRLLSRRARIARWVGAILGLPVGGFFEICGVYFSWRGTAGAGGWWEEQATFWSSAAYALCVAAFLAFGYCVASLIVDTNRRRLTRTGSAAPPRAG